MSHLFGRAWAGEFECFFSAQQVLPGARAQWAPDCKALVQHIKLELEVDLSSKTVAGTCSQTVRAVRDLDRLTFDAVDLKIKSVTRGKGLKCAFQVGDDKLTIHLHPPLQAGRLETVNIHYSVTDPILGLYFIRPTESYPNKPWQVWSQGQDEDNRYWFPCHDFPNQKATSEMVVTVDEKYFALSNGKLLGVKKQGKKKTYHWKQSIPHVSYLVTLAVGEFAERRGEAKGIPVLYYVPPGREADGERAFGNTPRMIKFFSEKTGVTYPYEKYAQIAVSDFVFGGMENTTATTQTDLTLHDARAHLDFSSDPLVSHELAHQWFGDLLTCRDWSHAWLNEGFATYFQALWTEHDRGVDEFRYDMFQKAKSYFDEDSGRYRRPIVTNVYEEAIDLFDRHIYEKGSLVLHMLRRWLGDDCWWKSIRRYLETFRGRNVETRDLMRAIEEATGLNPDRFFDQWVFKAGYPDLEVSWAYDDQQQLGTLTVKQKEAFWVSTEIAIATASGTTLHPIEIERPEQSFMVRTEKPLAVRLDPGNWVLKKLKFKRPRAMLEHQLAHDSDCMGRIEAIHELAELGSIEAVKAIRKAMVEDKFWGVQLEAAAALGKIKSEPALAALLEGTRVKHPKARRAVAEALGEFRIEKAGDALIEWLGKGDPSYYVEASASVALGRTRHPRAVEVLKKVLDRPSHNEVIRAGACDGLGATETPEAFEPLAEMSALGKPQLARLAAIRTLGRLGDTLPDLKRNVRDLLLRYFTEADFRTRMNVITALRSLRDDAAIPYLQSLVARRGDGRTRRSAREAIEAIRKGRSREEDVKKVREDMEKVVEENRKLRDRLDKLEQKGKLMPEKRRKH